MRAAEHWRLQGLNKLEIRLNFLPQFHKLHFLSLHSQPGMLGCRRQLWHRGCHFLSDELGSLKVPSREHFCSQPSFSDLPQPRSLMASRSIRTINPS